MASAKKLPGLAYAGVKISNKKAEVSLLIGDRFIKQNISLKNFESWFGKTAIRQNIKIVSAALQGSGDLRKLGSKLWLKEDIVPLIIRNHTDKNTYQLASFASSRFMDGIATINLGPDNKVETAELVTLSEYRKIAPKGDFDLLLKLANKINKKKLVFFSATPRGGGVALMRHALMRLYKLLGIDASWHVMQESPEVFEITKKKFHNVLHGISAPSVRFTKKDKQVYENWIEQNAEKLHTLFHQAKVIVIDDPQPCGLVLHIKKVSPKTKIIYRSHIQLETRLFSNPKHAQSVTWNYIWGNIKNIDLFISHPIPKFIPKIVDPNKVVYMTACIDSLDGLNKPLTKSQTDYYFEVFNKNLTDQGQTPLDRTRPYIIQVARFDPSKGIADVLDAYCKLRVMLNGSSYPIPQLVITGQGSVDDPEGLPIYNETLSILRAKKYQDIRDDIKIVRTPAIDQIQNTLMRNAYLYLQLSHKEGFEDKISASLLMGVPAIVYSVGGMPQQVVDGRSGYIVDVGKTNKAAKFMFDLLADKKLRKSMSNNAKKMVIPDITIVNNAINWLYLANELVDKGKVKGNMQKVYDMARSR